jgi:hypothetical protein
MRDLSGADLHRVAFCTAHRRRYAFVRAEKPAG